MKYSQQHAEAQNRHGEALFQTPDQASATAETSASEGGQAQGQEKGLFGSAYSGGLSEAAAGIPGAVGSIPGALGAIPALAAGAVKQHHERHRGVQHHGEPDLAAVPEDGQAGLSSTCTLSSGFCTKVRPSPSASYILASLPRREPVNTYLPATIRIRGHAESTVKFLSMYCEAMRQTPDTSQGRKEFFSVTLPQPALLGLDSMGGLGVTCMQRTEDDASKAAADDETAYEREARHESAAAGLFRLVVAEATGGQVSFLVSASLLLARA